jgi:hypothetical protein
MPAIDSLVSWAGWVASRWQVGDRLVPAGIALSCRQAPRICTLRCRHLLHPTGLPAAAALLPRRCTAQSTEVYMLVRSNDGDMRAVISKAAELRACVAQAVAAVAHADFLVSGRYVVLGLPLLPASCSCTQALNPSHQATCHRLPSPAMSTRGLLQCSSLQGRAAAAAPAPNPREERLVGERPAGGPAATAAAAGAAGQASACLPCAGCAAVVKRNHAPSCMRGSPAPCPATVLLYRSCWNHHAASLYLPRCAACPCNCRAALRLRPQRPPQWRSA